MIKLKILRIFFLFALFCYNLGATNIKVKTGAKEILQQKKILIFVTPKDGFAIFKKHVLFSIDNPHIIIKSWKIKERAQLEHVQSFGKEKKLFFKPFTVELLVDFLTRDMGVVRQALAESCVSMSCVVLLDDGTSKPEHLLIPLAKQCVMPKEQEVLQKPGLKNLEIKKCDAVEQSVNENRSIKTLLIVSILLFLLSFVCFFERSQRFLTVQYAIGIVLFCFATSFLIKILLIQKLWPFHFL